MKLKGLKLPPLFLQDVEGIKTEQSIPVGISSDVDAFGFDFDVDAFDLFNLDAVERETENLPKGFEPDGYYGETDENDDRRNYPGFIPDIIDFSKIVCFGDGGDASPFCFDFREDINDPSIIWWADDHWRKVAPNYESFRALLDFRKPD